MDQPPYDVPPLAPGEDVNTGDGPLSKEQVRRAEKGPSRPPGRPGLVKSLWYFALANVTAALFGIVGAFVWGWASHMIISFWNYGWQLIS